MRKITKDELKGMLERHRHWLSCHGEEKNEAERFSAVGMDLSGMDLSGAKLSRAKLCRADLSDADLSGADLSGADLFDADLTGANLFDANLFGANLSIGRANPELCDALVKVFEARMAIVKACHKGDEDED